MQMPYDHTDTADDTKLFYSHEGPHTSHWNIYGKLQCSYLNRSSRCLWEAVQCCLIYILFFSFSSVRQHNEWPCLKITNGLEFNHVSTMSHNAYKAIMRYMPPQRNVMRCTYGWLVCSSCVHVWSTVDSPPQEYESSLWQLRQGLHQEYREL